MDTIFALFIATIILAIALHIGLSFLGFKNAVPGAVKKGIRLFFRGLWWPFRLAYEQIKIALTEKRKPRGR
jgi:hypothetical protein